MMCRLGIFIFTFTFAASASAVTASEKKTLDEMINELEEDLAPKENLSTLEKLEDVHEAISEDIEEVANRIDSFFVNDTVVYGRNNTNVRVLTTVTDREKEGVDAGVDFKVRLRLPRLEDKVQLEVGRQLDQTAVDSNSKVSPTLQLQNNPNAQRSTRTGLAFFKDFFTLKSKVSGGIRYDSGLNPYTNFRLSRNFKITRRQNFNLITNWYWEEKDKTAQFTTLYYDIILKSNLLFRVSNESVYRDLANTYDTFHGVFLFHELNDRNTISYSAGIHARNDGGDDSYYLAEYYVGPNWRHRLYKRFLYVDGGPTLTWPKAQQFEPIWGFTVHLEVIFGKI